MNWNSGTKKELDYHSGPSAKKYEKGIRKELE